MRLRRDTYPTDPIRDKAAARATRLSEAEMLDWADIAGSAIARSLRDYQKTHDPLPLTEAREAISALQGVIDVLTERTQSK